jgi:hypothetical protein
LRHKVLVLFAAANIKKGTPFKRFSGKTLLKIAGLNDEKRKNKIHKILSAD